MQNRRDFLKTAALAAFGSGLVARQALAGESLLSTIQQHCSWLVIFPVSSGDLPA